MQKCSPDYQCIFRWIDDAKSLEYTWFVVFCGALKPNDLVRGLSGDGEWNRHLKWPRPPFLPSVRLPSNDSVSLTGTAAFEACCRDFRTLCRAPGNEYFFQDSVGQNYTFNVSDRL